MRTLVEIYDSIPQDLLDSEGPLTAAQKKQLVGIENFLMGHIEDISKMFSGNDPVTSDELMAVLVDMIPAHKIVAIEAKSNRIQELRFPNGDADQDGSKASYAIMTIVGAASYKTRVIEGLSKSLAVELHEAEEKIQAGQGSPSELKTAQKDFDFLKKCQDVIVKLQGLTYAKKTESIANTISMIKNMVADSDDAIANSKVAEKLEELEKAYLSVLVAINHVDHEHDQNLEKLLDIVEKLRVQNINEITSVLVNEIQSLTTKIPPGRHNQLLEQLNELQSDAMKLSLPGIDSDEFVRVEKSFQQKFEKIHAAAKEAPNLETSLQYREVEAIALAEGKKQLPQDIYTYIFSGKDLRHSQNEFIQDQFAFNPAPIHDDNKFILSGRLPDNLFQIRKDAQRNLTLEGEEHKYGEGQNEAFRKVLVEKFGEKNTADMIGHFDQTVSLMIVSPITIALESREGQIGEMISPAPPEKVTQNMYMKNNIVFRDAAMESIILNVPEDENTPRWKIKNDIKIVSFVSEDGFVVQNMGCSDPLMAACLIEKDCSADIKLLVDSILKIEQSLEAKTGRLTDTTKGKLKKDTHKDAINTAIALIQAFKSGELSFGALTKQVGDLSVKAAALPHASVVGKLKGKVGKKTGTKIVLDTISKTLTDLNTKFEAKVKAYANVKSPGLTSEAEIVYRPPISQQLFSHRDEKVEAAKTAEPAMDNKIRLTKP